MNRSELPQKRRRGRPPGAENLGTIVKRIAAERHRIRHRDRPLELTTLEAVIQILQHEAMKGNLPAIRIRDKYLGRYLEQVEPPAGAGVVVVPEDMSPEAWIKEMQQKNARMDQIRQEVLRERH